MDPFVLAGICLGLVSIGISLTSFLVYRKRINKIEKRVIILHNELNRIVWENVFILGGKGEKELFKEGLLELAKRLFKLVKKRFRIHATDYSELIDELEEREIKPKLKASLIEFFSAILALQYSNRKISDIEKIRLKREAIELIKKMGGTLSMPIKSK